MKKFVSLPIILFQLFITFITLFVIYLLFALLDMDEFDMITEGAFLIFHICNNSFNVDNYSLSYCGASNKTSAESENVVESSTGYTCRCTDSWNNFAFAFFKR
jgi:hypothetical protein